MPGLIPMIGKRFTRLVVLQRVENNSERKARYLCKCDCGNQITTTGKSLRTQRTKSCGCYGYEVRRLAVTKHGHAFTPTYRTWRGILDRCHNPNSFEYARYGGAGIYVCSRWKKNFKNFLQDMGERPEGMTIDRINNSLGYSPKNCRWSTRKEQANNKTNNRHLTLNGLTLTLAQWCERLNIDRGVLQSRLSRGWADDKVLTFTTRTCASLTIDDTTKSIAEWCRYYKINYLTVHTRIKRGWSPILALTTKPK